MQKIEIVINRPDYDKVREILDMILKHALDVLTLFGIPCSGIVLYNVQETEEENV